MARSFARSMGLFPALVLIALAMLLLPDITVQRLRGHAISTLSPMLRVCASFRPAQAPVPALITSATQDASAPPTENLAPALDQANATIVRLESELGKFRAAQRRNGDARLPTGIAADVIARQVLWQEPLLGIDRGETDGVKLNAGVLFRGAVAGRVVSVGARASCVALVTHRGVSIGARLSDCRVEGILQGAPASADESAERVCRMVIVAKELNAKVGENVVTSGYDGTFPSGLWLGVVSAINKKSDVQWEVQVRPACTLNAIESVQVLTCAPPEVPWPAAPVKRRSK